ncbi:MAG: hypothetical protein HYS64_00615 [Rhodospirillales bacterium]|nr:hypothetical protein [Rhodospirillales bacterium]
MSRQSQQDMELPRCPPETIPDIHPILEYRASSQLKARYEEMKRVFAKCLDPMIPKRYRNAAELLRDLDVIHRRLWPTG